jgi:hypothetical protein
LAEEMREIGFDVTDDTMRRILIEELGLSRRQAFKYESVCRFPQRDEQFLHISDLREEYERHDWPVISIDTKKKEILGNFWHAGSAYTDGRVVVRDHDFVTAQDRLVPYGVYDVRRNEALMLLARGADTCELACDAIWRWWKRLGEKHYQLPRACSCYVIAAEATAIASIVLKRSYATWLPTWGAISAWPTTRQAVPNTIRSSIDCSAT